MGELNLSAFDYILKYKMLGPIRQQFADKIDFLKRISRTAAHIDGTGRKVLIPLLMNTGQSVGARSDGGALPTAAASTTYESQTTLKHNYATLRVTGPTIRASRKNASAFARAVTFEMKNKMLALKQDLERQFFGYGKGFMAQVNGAVAGQVITVDNPGTKYLKTGMVIDVVDSSGTKSANSVTISSIDSTNSTVTITAGGDISSVSDNEYLVREDAYNIEMMGLRGIIDDDTLLSSLQGVDSGTYTDWQGKVYDNSGTNRDLTLALMQTPFSYCEEEEGTDVVMYTTFAVRDKYADLLTADKRFVNTLNLDGGFKALDFNGRPLIPIAYCYPNKIFYVFENLLEIAQYSDIAWADEDGSVLHKVSGYDIYEADLYWDSELITVKRKPHALLDDITES